MSANARSRAAEVLEVPADAGAEAVCTAFLVSLPAAGFVPPQEAVAAVNALAGLDVPVDANASPTVREEVEEFIARYWKLKPSERLAAWMKLTSRRPDDAVAERLLALQAGLELAAAPAADPRQEELMALARELYLLPPRERAVLRNEWLLENAGQLREWVEVAAKVRKALPAAAALDPELFERLSGAFQVNIFAHAATAAPLPVRPYRVPEPIIHPTRATAAVAREYSRRGHSSERKSGWQVGWGVMFGLFVLFKLIASLSSVDQPRSSYSIPQSPRTWQGDLPDKSTHEAVLDRLRDFHLEVRQGEGVLTMCDGTPEQIQSFKAYERGLKPGNGAAAEPPPGYEAWKMLGRPNSGQRKTGEMPSRPSTGR